MTTFMITDRVTSSTSSLMLNKYSIEISGSTKFHLKHELEQAKSSLMIKSIPLTEELISILKSIKKEKHHLESLLFELKHLEGSKDSQIEHQKRIYALYDSYDVKPGGSFEAHLKERATSGNDPRIDEKIKTLDIAIQMQDTKLKNIQIKFDQKSAHIPKENYEEILEELEYFTRVIENVEDSIMNNHHELTKIEKIWFYMALSHIENSLTEESKQITLQLPATDYKKRDLSPAKKIEIFETIRSIWKKINDYFQIDENLDYSAEDETFTLTQAQARRWLHASRHHYANHILDLL